MAGDPTLIGRVTRSSTLGFVGALKSPEPEIPVFGTFCKSEAQRGKSDVLGVIYNINIEDDDLTRQIAAAERPTEEELADQQYVRQIPIEFEALAVGYRLTETYFYTLPPQPPLALAPIRPMKSDEIVQFTNQFEFIPLILSASNLPVDALLAACLRKASVARPRQERQNFLLEAGRYCAKLLSHDLPRMDSFLRILSFEEKSVI